MFQLRDSLKNANDLTGKLYYGVKISAADTGAIVSAATDNVYGVNLTKAKANERITVCVAGVTKMKAGGTISAGNKLKIDASGTFVAANSGDVCIGTARTAASSGGVFEGVFFGGLQAETIVG